MFVLIAKQNKKQFSLFKKMTHPDKLFGRLGNRMFQMAFIYARMKDGLIPDIFLQDHRLFKNYEKELQELYGQGIGYLQHVAIHVRRGANPLNSSEPKYSDNPFYVNISETAYYEKAIAMFPGDNFLVFSDDVAYCKEKWGGNEKFHIVEKGDEIEDFNLMASCKSQIIANSSYSWWAGYLNPNPEKKVVYPGKWFTDGIERVTFPNTWIKI